MVDILGRAARWTLAALVSLVLCAWAVLALLMTLIGPCNDGLPEPAGALWAVLTLLAIAGLGAAGAFWTSAEACRLAAHGRRAAKRFVLALLLTAGTYVGWYTFASYMVGS